MLNVGRKHYRLFLLSQSNTVFPVWAGEVKLLNQYTFADKRHNPAPAHDVSSVLEFDDILSALTPLGPELVSTVLAG